ncbi:Glyoxalase family protein [hydrothermal vent metagenome]|uniref:Glyoxalase family protein n=1 Tax=hydrothermal vent metagenome TaxID=652676 RepID=A0A3B0RUA6_9ZZZZ
MAFAPSRFSFGMLFAAGFVIALTGCNAQDAATTHSLEEAVVTHTNNHIDYVEFAAEDLSVAKAFYAAAFGWEFQDWAPTYVSFSGAGVEGGIRGGETPVNGSTLVILYADDLEASEKRVVEAGGEVTERHEFPGGKRFHFRDPSGNVLGVWTLVEAEG